jgi:hypothetical protein
MFWGIKYGELLEMLTSFFLGVFYFIKWLNYGIRHLILAKLLELLLVTQPIFKNWFLEMVGCYRNHF